MNIQNLTHQYALSKTLRFRLIPEGETLANIEKNGILTEDKKRAGEYRKAKKIIDRYHKDFIERVLSGMNFSAETLEHFAATYYARKSGEAEAAAYKTEKADLCRTIALLMKKDSGYKPLFGKDLICTVLPKFVETDEEREIIGDFARFATYFYDFNKNRENMYTENEDATGIANRIINDNLPKFFDNVKAGEKVLATLPPETIAAVNADFEALYGVTVEEILSLAYANRVFSQTQIDAYNGILGGYAAEDGTKIQGLNEKINLYNQTHENRIPKLKMLFKQILSDRESVSYIPEEFATDDEVLTAIAQYCKETRANRDNIQKTLRAMDTAGVFVAGKTVNSLSQEVFGDWSQIGRGLTDKREFYSLAALQRAGEVGAEGAAVQDLAAYVADGAQTRAAAVETAMTAFEKTLSVPYQGAVRLAKNGDAVIIVKTLMDAVKDFQAFVGMFYDGRDEQDADPVFYGEFVNDYEAICPVIKLYNKVRNYISKKPYSLEKFKLNFNRSDFLSGWAQPTEYNASEAHLFEKDGQYYVLITNGSWKPADVERLKQVPPDSVRAVHWNYYFQKPDNKNTPRLFIRSKGDSYAPAVKEYDLPIDDVIEAYDNGWFKTEYAKKDPVKFKQSLAKVIDYFKLGFMRHASYADFHFEWKPTSEYETIADFYQDTIASCYRVESETINYSELLKLVAEEKGYLFRLYSKDFSPYSKGTPNLHTLYFKMLFDARNGRAGVYKLCGGAEMFYRPASLQLNETTVHRANEPLQNKNGSNAKKTSTFVYDIVKDKRFTAPQFALHLPIAMNFKSGDMRSSGLNKTVRTAIARADDQYVIGIDRGERHLLYVSLIDGTGRIVEQRSLNVIENTYRGRAYATDYRALLADKEEKRTDARREWQTIGNIKDLKEGYLSQAVDLICRWVVQYGAIIVMENLNVGFKHTRSAVESSVYQKFETMLSGKLSYLASKKADPEAIGGILNAYQLACPVTSYQDLRGQNGVVFYIPAWMTSKIDPATGFAALFRPRYKNEADAKAFLQKFRSIAYNAEKGYFEFAFSYDDFGEKADHQKTWTVCTFGDRIDTHRDPARLNNWVNEKIDLTAAFIALFNQFGVAYRRGDLKEQLLARSGKAFYEKLLHLIALTLQMRNSISGSAAAEDDYMISPVQNACGAFYDSRKADAAQPCDADANGAYNIARKGLMLVERLQAAADPTEVSLAITNGEWLAFAQEHPCL